MKYGIFPRIHVKPNSNTAENNILGITIDPQFPLYAAAMAEERREFLYQWKMLAIGVFFSLLLTFTLSQYFLPLGIFACLVYFALPSIDREIELVGHSAYCSAGSQMYGIPIEKLLDEAANSLHTSSDYKFFHKIPVEQIRKRIVDKLPAANTWVFNNMPRLARDLKRIKHD